MNLLLKMDDLWHCSASFRNHIIRQRGRNTQLQQVFLRWKLMIFALQMVKFAWNVMQSVWKMMNFALNMMQGCCRSAPCTLCSKILAFFTPNGEGDVEKVGISIQKRWILHLKRWILHLKRWILHSKTMNSACKTMNSAFTNDEFCIQNGEVYIKRDKLCTNTAMCICQVYALFDSKQRAANVVPLNSRQHRHPFAAQVLCIQKWWILMNFVLNNDLFVPQSAGYPQEEECAEQSESRFAAWFSNETG